MGGMLRPAPAHTRGGRASCGARRRSPCTGRRPAGRRTKSSSTCRSQLRTQNNKFAIAISSGAAVTGRLINRRPAPRSRELLCTDGVVERVAAHHAHALGRQRHAGTEQSLHLCGCCRGASTLRDDDGGFGHGCETTSSAHALGFEKVAVVGLTHR